jgi:hypothetical protein
MAAACAAMIVGGASAQDAVQWRVEDGGNGHWYRFDQQVLHWTPHRDHAASQGAYLATVTSEAERSFVESILYVQEADIWLGGQSNWPAPMSWVTGEPFEYAFWCPGGFNPGGGYAVELCGRSNCLGQFCWNIESEIAQGWPGNRAVYEWSADCNSDGIVDYGQIRDGSLPDYNGNNIPDCCEQGVPCVVGDNPVQWRESEGGNGHWYQLRPKVGDWFACRVAAQVLQGDLASTSTDPENSFVERIVPPKQFPIWNRVFLGGRQIPNSAPNEGWYWVDGSEWSYTDWYFNQPNGGETFLVTMPDENGCTWGDYPADSGDIYYFIIEWSADCNSDGIVDYGQILTGQLADTNANGIPDTCEVDPCPGDITNNGVVNGTDLAAVLAAWGSDGSNKFDCDIDNDGVVSGSDLAFVLAGWGACP